MWVVPAPGALMPSQPLFSKRASVPASTATRPSIAPPFTMTVPEADAPVRIASTPGAAMIEPALSSVPKTPLSSTAALPDPVTVIVPLLVITP
jgi:hypothetical protein